MPNPRSTRQRKRRTVGLRPEERAFLTGVQVPGQNPFARFGLSRAALNPHELEQRLAMVAKYGDLIPEARRPIIEKYIEVWRGELPPGQIGETARWNP